MLSRTTTTVAETVFASLMLDRSRRDLKHVDTSARGPLENRCTGSARFVFVGLGGRKGDRRSRDGAIVRNSVRKGLRGTCESCKYDLGLAVRFPCFGCGMFDFPPSAANSPANPFWGSSLRESVGERYAIPGNESIVSLDSNAGVGANLSFQDTGSCASTLSQGARPFLQKVQGIES